MIISESTCSLKEVCSRKLSAGLRCVALALIGVLLLVSSIEISELGLAQQTRTVCPEGPPRCDFAKIQRAINAAGEGDIIQIAPGTYKENLEIHDKALVLRGAGPDKVILDGKGLGGNGIEIRGRAYVTVDALTVRGYSYSGLRVDDSAQVNLTNSQVFGNSLGLWVWGSPTVSLTGSTVSGNVGSGLALMSGSAAHVSLSSSTVSGNDSGLSVWGSSLVSLNNSTVSGNRSDGLTVGASAKVEIRESFFKDNRRCGIQVSSREAQARGGPNEMYGNGVDLCGFAPAALRKPLQPEDLTKILLHVPEDYRTVQEAIDALAPGGTIIVQAGSYEAGLTIWKPLKLQGVGWEQTTLNALPERELAVSVTAEAEGVTLEGLKVAGSQGYGLLIYGGLEARRVQVSRNRWGGLEVRSSAHVNLTNSQVSENGGDGLFVAGSAHVSLTNSQISENGDGLEVGGSATVSLTDSAILGSWRDGLKVQGSAQLTLKNSTVEKNGTSPNCADYICNGITVGDESRITIIDSEIIDNADWGVAAWLRKCGYSSDNFTGKVEFQGNNMIKGNKLGQVCLP